MQNDLLLRMQSWLDAQPPQEGRTFDLMHPEVLISSALQTLVLQERALRLGVDMREKQKAYFKRRFQDVLIDCKKAESSFDKAASLALGEEL
jgi:hypothetical protein